LTTKADTQLQTRWKDIGNHRQTTSPST